MAVVSPELYARDLTWLAQEVVLYLAARRGAALETQIETTARRPGRYPDDRVSNVTGNTRTLIFETCGSEDD